MAGPYGPDVAVASVNSLVAPTPPVPRALDTLVHARSTPRHGTVTPPVTSQPTPAVFD